MLVWSCLGFWALFMRIQDDKVNNMLGVVLQACGKILGADVAAGMCAWIIKGLIFLIGLVLLNISPSFVFSVWLIEKGLAPDAGCCWRREHSADFLPTFQQYSAIFYCMDSKNSTFFLAII